MKKNREGNKGSISLFFKGTLFAMYPLSDEYNLDYYYDTGEDIIRKSKDMGYNIKQQLIVYYGFLNKIERRKREKLPIYASDLDKATHALFALLRLRLIEDDELNGYLIMRRYRIKSRN
jgi:exopolyphosphatase/pppGpp-phosphohydrolase